MLAFQFSEKMRGTYHLFANPIAELPMEFSIEIEGSGLRRFSKEKIAKIRGEVTMAGLASVRPIDGLFGFKMLDERRVTYAFSFEGDDGLRYGFRGQKEWSVFRIVDSLSLLPASIYDANDVEIGRAILRLDLRGDAERMLRSFRVKLA